VLKTSLRTETAGYFSIDHFSFKDRSDCGPK